MKDYKANDIQEEYAELVKGLQVVGESEPDPAFRTAARQRLLTAIGETSGEITSPAKVVRLRPRRMAVRILAAAALLGLLMTGVGFASTSSLPGDTLYPVKRAIENGRLKLTRGESAKAKLEIEFAGRRKRESDALTRANRASLAAGARAEMKKLNESANRRLKKQRPAKKQRPDKIKKFPSGRIPGGRTGVINGEGGGNHEKNERNARFNGISSNPGRSPVPGFGIGSRARSR